jgi:hypothetical protein
MRSSRLRHGQKLPVTRVFALLIQRLGTLKPWIPARKRYGNDGFGAAGMTVLMSQAGLQCDLAFSAIWQQMLFPSFLNCDTVTHALVRHPEIMKI